MWHHIRGFTRCAELVVKRGLVPALPSLTRQDPLSRSSTHADTRGKIWLCKFTCIEVLVCTYIKEQMLSMVLAFEEIRT